MRRSTRSELLHTYAYLTKTDLGADQDYVSRATKVKNGITAQ